MQIEYVGRGTGVDDAVRRYAEEKLGKLARLVEEPVAVRLTCELERHRHVVDLHLAHRHGVLQATEETATDWRDAINAAVDKLEKQARRGRKKVVARRRRGTPPPPAAAGTTSEPAPTTG